MGWWELYGLEGNPFSTNPIKVDSEDKDSSIEGFKVIKEINNNLTIIKNRLMLGGETKSVVYGETGVGKTSFVNYILHEMKDKLFFAQVNVKSDWTAQLFLINTLSAILDAIEERGDKNWLDKKTFKELESVVKLNRVSGIGGGLSLGAISGNYNQETSNPQEIPVDQLERLFEKIANQIYNNRHEEIIIVYDDLNNLLNGDGSKNSKEEELIENFKKVFDDLKTTFQTKYVHFIFIGDYITDLTIQVTSIRDIISKPSIFIPVMKRDEIISVIEHRVEVMRKKSQKSLKPLYEKSVLETLYDIYGGNIRNILTRLNDFFISHAPGEFITKDILGKNLLEEAKQQFQELNISRRHNKIKQIMIFLAGRKEAKTGNITKAVGSNNSSNVVRYMEKDLHGLVRQTRKTAKDRYWALNPEIKWLIKNHYLDDLI